MNHRHFSLWARFKRIADNVTSGSAPSVCPGCRSPRVAAGAPLGLCPDCLAGIPWIKEIRCPVCGRPDDCPDCARRQETFFVQSRSAVRYDDVMKTWLARWKYRGDEKMAALFAGMVMHAYRKYADRGIAIDCITYVPLSRTRYLERGFNQAGQMVELLGGALRLPVVPLLERVLHTDKQSFKTRSDRLADLKGVFQADAAGIERLASLARKKDAVREPIRILLLDDVYTTGSTLNRCAEAIKEAVASEVYGLTWAR